jgi:hypothetical protein
MRRSFRQSRCGSPIRACRERISTASRRHGFGSPGTRNQPQSGRASPSRIDRRSSGPATDRLNKRHARHRPARIKIIGIRRACFGLFAQGGDGCISVTSNIAPALCHAMFMAWKHNQTARARRLAVPIAQLTAALSRESDPVLVKHALFLFGLMSPRVRLPLVESSTQSRVELGRVLARMCDEYSEYMIGGVREYGDVATCAAVVGGT